MPNILNENGLTVSTAAEMRATLYAKMRAIYGSDINLDQDSPDAQMLEIFIISMVDALETAVNIYNSFDPDKAVGRVLDQRVGLNGIQRKAGTYTIVPIQVEISQAVTLFGLDQTVEDVYTISDDSGTEFQLSATIDLPSPGTYTLIFQASEPGKVEVLVNTIVNPVTVILGVVSVNNPDPAITIGIDEETDAELRIRRQKSTSIASEGFIDGLKAALSNVNGITDVAVYENDTSINPDANGTPAHSIWVVVDGVYNQSEVANIIYAKRGTGAGMRGEITFPIVRNGKSFVVKWDEVILENLYIELEIEPLNPDIPLDINNIRTKLPVGFTSEIGGVENMNEIAAKVQAIDPNALVVGGGLSLSPAGPFENKLEVSEANRRFVLLSENIIITPMEIFPSVVSVTGGPTPVSRTLLAYGGYGAYTWEVLVDNSGAGGDPATIDADGLYTPGTGTQNVEDTVRVTDSLGNTATINIEVT